MHLVLINLHKSKILQHIKYSMIKEKPFSHKSYINLLVNLEELNLKNYLIECKLYQDVAFYNINLIDKNTPPLKKI